MTNRNAESVYTRPIPRSRREAENIRVGFVIAGFIAQVVLLLGPVHELGHLLATWAMGWRVEQIGWARIRVNYLNGFTLAAGTLFEMIVWGAIMLRCTRRWSRMGFFATGAFTAAAVVWWVSGDREQIVRIYSAGLSVWDLAVLLAAVTGLLTRRHQMWVNNPKTMRMVTGRSLPPEIAAKPRLSNPQGAGGKYRGVWNHV